MGVTAHSMGSGIWVPIPPGYMHLKIKKIPYGYMQLSLPSAEIKLFMILGPVYISWFNL